MVSSTGAKERMTGSGGCPQCGWSWAKVGPDGYHCERCGFFPREEASAQRDDEEPPSGSNPSQTTRLVQLATSASELFRNPDGEAFAALEVDGHRETHAIGSRGFKVWLAQRVYTAEGKAVAGNALADAVTSLEGKALYEGAVRTVWTRVAEDTDDNILIDLGSDAWDAVKVTPSGWDLVRIPDVHFRRARTTAALPMPVRGGSLEEMRRLLNLADDRDFRRVGGWLVGALRPRPPYPVLAFSAEHGSGKSVTARCIRSLVDPSSLPLRTPPKDERDLAISARGNHILALDNISYIPRWLSNALCRIATGDGLATRKLYTDDEEQVFNFARPVVLTGIDDYVVASDLLDRSLFATLSAIPANERQQEAEIYKQFDDMLPRLFGALLDAVAMALANRHQVWTGLPRMADFVAWVMNAEEALPWPAGAFYESYAHNAATAHEIVVESSAIAEELQRFAEAHAPDGWSGTATELLKALDARVGDDVRRKKRWPKTPKLLSDQVRRIMPTLRAIGVQVAFEREANVGRRRLIHVNNVDLEGVDAVDAGQDASMDAASRPVDAGVEDPIGESEARVDAVDAEIPSVEGWEEEI